MAQGSLERSGGGTKTVKGRDDGCLQGNHVFQTQQGGCVSHMNFQQLKTACERPAQTQVTKSQNGEEMGLKSLS